jgi:hypothetical protein
VLRAEVERAKDDPSPLEVVVEVQPFNYLHTTCIPPATIKKAVSGP